MMDAAGLVGREVTVPASTSNLGPGFDVLGLALQLYLRLRVEAADPARPGQVVWRHTSSPPTGPDLIDAAFHRLADGSRPWPGLTVRVTSDIPERSGLGSSAAAIVAGLRLATLVTGSGADADLLREAVALEGHPDNVSAALLGGLTVSCVAGDGTVHTLSAAWPTGWRLVIATPAVQVETRRARAVLPALVSLADAVHNLQRATLLVAAVHQGRADVVREALADRLHQPYRASLVPGLTEVLSWRAPRLVGTFLSGAGPSIAAIVTDDGEEVRARFQALYARLGLPCEVRVLDVHPPSRAAARESGSEHS